MGDVKYFVKLKKEDGTPVKGAQITAHQLIQAADEKIELSAAYFSDCKR